LTDLSLSAMGRIIKKVDPSIRAGIESREELRRSMEDYGTRLAELATSIARSANRNTILPQDITTARQQVMRSIAYHQSQYQK